MYQGRMYQGRMYQGRMYQGRMYQGRMYQGRICQGLVPGGASVARLPGPSQFRQRDDRAIDEVTLAAQLPQERARECRGHADPVAHQLRANWPFRIH